MARKGHGCVCQPNVVFIPAVQRMHMAGTDACIAARLGCRQLLVILERSVVATAALWGAPMLTHLQLLAVERLSCGMAVRVCCIHVKLM